MRAFLCCSLHHGTPEQWYELHLHKLFSYMFTHEGFTWGQLTRHYCVLHFITRFKFIVNIMKNMMDGIVYFVNLSDSIPFPADRAMDTSDCCLWIGVPTTSGPFISFSLLPPRTCFISFFSIPPGTCHVEQLAVGLLFLHPMVLFMILQGRAPY